MSLRYATQGSNSLFQKFNAILLSTDVDLAVDAINVGVESQNDAKCLGERIDQR